MTYRPATTPICTGLKANGESCPRHSVLGGTRCSIHGGKTPQALVKSKAMLAILRVPAIEGLYLVIEKMTEAVEQLTSSTCAACGYPAATKGERSHLARVCGRLSQASQMVLDRTDMGPKVTLEIPQSDFDFDVKALLPGEEQELDQILAMFDNFKGRIQKRLNVVAFDQPLSVVQVASEPEPEAIH